MLGAFLAVACGNFIFEHEWRIRIGHKDSRTKDDDVRRHAPPP
jgi:hypothetical protein